jgi:hypothetical protein
MKHIFFRKGDKVMIYQKPVTQEDQEGMAELVQFVGKADYAPYLETWEVRFDGDQDRETFTRTLLPEVREEEGKKVTKSDLIGREHATFTIIAVRDSMVPGKKIVLGYRKLTGQFQGITVEYVVWIYNKTTDCFFYGKYYSDIIEAVDHYQKEVT